MTKQAYYKWLNNEGRYRKAAQEGFVVEYADEIREKDPGIGGVKIWQMYAEKTKKTDAYVGRDRFLDVLREAGKLRGAPVKGVKTTDSKHGLPVYHDLRKELVPSRPDQEWDSDITYIPLDNDQWVYLTTIIDAYTHAVVGWKVAPTLEYEHSLEALEMAIKNRKEKVGSLEGLIHHSDRGKQYCSKGYTQRLIEEGIEISMTESGNPKDNAVAERMNNTVKNELCAGSTFKNLEEVERTLQKRFDFYNNERPHMSNGPERLTPMEAYNYVGIMQKQWLSYRTIAILGDNAKIGAVRIAPAGG